MTAELVAYSEAIDAEIGRIPIDPASYVVYRQNEEHAEHEDHNTASGQVGELLTNT